MKSRIGNMVNAYLNVRKGEKVFYYCPEKDARKIYEIELVDRKIYFIINRSLKHFVIDIKNYFKLPNSEKLYLYDNINDKKFFLYKTKEDAIENKFIQPERINIAEYIDAQFGNIPAFANPTIYKVDYALRTITAIDFSDFVFNESDFPERAELDFDNPLKDKENLNKMFRCASNTFNYFIDKEDAEKAIRKFEFVTFHSN